MYAIINKHTKKEIIGNLKSERSAKIMMTKIARAEATKVGYMVMSPNDYRHNHKIITR